jgi:glycerol kinase
VIEAMKSDSGVTLTSLKVDGGASKNELLMQFQSDLLNVPLHRPVVNETTALGSAYAAGLGVGFYQDLEEIKGSWKADKRWDPHMTSDKRDHLVSSLHSSLTLYFSPILFTSLDLPLVEGYRKISELGRIELTT